MPEPGSYSSSSLPRVGDVLDGKYRIVRVIGEGAMGIVFEARNESAGTRVAIKMLQPRVAENTELARRFVQEARASSRIRHPNVVSVYEAGEWHGLGYLVMELLSGMTLGDYLEIRGRLSLAETMALLTPVCRGVMAAHEVHVIHRDLKPDNIFLCVTPGSTVSVPKVLDFGVSKVDDPTMTKVTQTGHSVGTALYMPLEQMIGAKGVTPASDVYAIGVIIYECLTASFPFEAHSVAELALRLSQTDPVPVDERNPTLPPEFGAALMKALEKDLDARYASVSEMMEALAPWGLGQAGHSVVSEELSLVSLSGEHARPTFGKFGSGDRLLGGSGIRNATTAETRVAPGLSSQSSHRSATPSPLSFGVSALLAVAVGTGIAVATRRADPPRVAPEAPMVGVGTGEAEPELAVAPSVVHIVAASHPHARVKIDGSDRGVLGPLGELDLTLTPGNHVFEVVDDSLVVGSAVVEVRRGERIEVAIPASHESPASETGTVPAGPTLSSEPARRGAQAPTMTGSQVESGSAQRRGVNVRGSFHVDPY